MSFFVSAPGKVILFGEHSAVYGKPAIAAALSLRAYLFVGPSANADDIVLEFPDIGLVHTWSRASLPWDDIAAVVPAEPATTENLVPELLDVLTDSLDIADPLHYTACRCFLYLYANLCSREIAGRRFIVRLTLPIGAGLGSLAATAVCLLSALSVLGGHVPEPQYGAHDHVPRNDSRGAAFIDAWALMGEKCFHGNPLGIDNAVATHGGAVMYQRRAGAGEAAVRTSVRNFAELPLLLTNTKVPRSTAALVGGVASLAARYGPTVESILEAMERLAAHAYELMVRLQCDRAALAELVRVNHGLLVALGVLHPCLEQVRLIADRRALGATKLTGAGGGGCAITLLGEDVDAAAVSAARSEFAAAGFECFDATLGGRGVGMLRDAPALVFAPDQFAACATRDLIEAMVGASVLDGWRYW